jgi:hypothetical protein
LSVRIVCGDGACKIRSETLHGRAVDTVCCNLVGHTWLLTQAPSSLFSIGAWTRHVSTTIWIKNQDVAKCFKSLVFYLENRQYPVPDCKLNMHPPPNAGSLKVLFPLRKLLMSIPSAYYSSQPLSGGLLCSKTYLSLGLFCG